MPRTNALRRKSPASVEVAPMNELLVSHEEAAQILSISKRSVEYLIAARHLPTRRIGTRALIPIEEVRRFARFDHPERIAG